MDVVQNDIKPANIFLRGSSVFIAGEKCSIYLSLFKFASHTVIKVTNLFVYVDQLDFGIATLHGAQNFLFTPRFASSGVHMRPIARYPIDDLESLVYTIWYIAGVPMVSSGEYEGFGLFQSYKDGTAKSRLMVCKKDISN